MITITQSVGVGGKNVRRDVLIIQQSLNKVTPALSVRKLLEDGLYGKNTATAIARFQKVHVNMLQPDGRVDPGGRTLRKLNEVLSPKDEPAGNGAKLLFPLQSRPAQSYKTGMRAYGSNRSSGKRKHAGVDLYAPKGTAIRAVKDGTVVKDYPFYLGTRAIEIDHGDLLIRYGEISHVAPGIKAGSKVKRGQIIAYVGELVFKSGNKMSMLHIEFYKGTMTGPLTVRGNKPYQRRSDLINPTTYLDQAVMK